MRSRGDQEDNLNFIRIPVNECVNLNRLCLKPPKTDSVSKAEPVYGVLPRWTCQQYYWLQAAGAPLLLEQLAVLPVTARTPVAPLMTALTRQGALALPTTGYV